MLLKKYGTDMKGEIRQIRTVIKEGAYGDPTKTGMWIYGYRPDGRTVACNRKKLKNGNQLISSRGWETEFTAEEWHKVLFAESEDQIGVCNKILNMRIK